MTSTFSSSLLVALHLCIRFAEAAVSLTGAVIHTHRLIPSPSFPVEVTGKALGPHMPSPCPWEERASSSSGFLQGPAYEKEMKIGVAKKDSYHNVNIC